jgi:hypothetical protein
METAHGNSSVASSKEHLLLHWFLCNLTTTERNSDWISRKSDKLINHWHQVTARSTHGQMWLHLRCCFYLTRNTKNWSLFHIYCISGTMTRKT